MKPFFRKHPFFLLTIAFICGIVLARNFMSSMEMHFIVSLAVLCSVFSLLLIAMPSTGPGVSTLHTAVIFFTLVLLGASAYLQGLPENQPRHFQHLKLESGYVPALVNVNRFDRNRLFCDVLMIDKQKVHGELCLYHEADSIRTGDLILCKVKVQSISGPRNPFAFSFKKYYGNKHIYHQASLKGKPIILARKSGLIRTFSQLRGRFKALLETTLSQEEYALCSALLLGDKSELGDEQKEAFADTGAMHVLAVSGLHVGVVYMIVLFFLKLFRATGFLWRLLRSILSLGSIWFFVYLVGAPISAWRAAFMFTLFEIGMLSARSSYPVNTLSFAAFLLLVLDPHTVFDVGFQLSFLAVFGIVTCQRPVQNMLDFNNPVLFKMWQLTALSISAQIFTLPLTVFYFHQFPIAFLISGLFAVFLASVILTFGLIFFILHGLPFLGVLLGSLVAFSAWFLNNCIAVLDSIPGLVWESLWLSPMQVMLLFLVSIAIALFLNNQYGPNLKWVLCSIVLFLFSTNYSMVKKMERSFLVFYHDSKGTYVDLIHRRTAYPIIEGDTIVPRDVANARMAMGVKGIGNWSDLSTIYFDSGFFAFGSHRTFFPDSLPLAAVGLPHHVETIFIKEPVPHLDLEGIGDSSKIVLASTLPGRGRFEERDLENQGLAYHNISAQGGFIIDLTRQP